MMWDNIIEKLEEPSLWLNSDVIKRKQQKALDMFRPQTIKQGTD